jgi:pyruvate,water dikinase
VDAPELLVPLDGARSLALTDVGGKAARLAELAGAGFRVPRGSCLTTAAYAAFVEEHGLAARVRVELGRKPLAETRWEEMWDAALRLRSLFLACALPASVEQALQAALAAFAPGTVLTVRSSAPHEDRAGASFAGLHESVGRVCGEAELRDAVRIVWASLWSDAALLYMAELGMDPARSRMAVVIQERVDATPSGLAFGIDPRGPDSDRQVVEAVPGGCGDLVDGVVDPDRWILERRAGAVVSWRPGARGAPEPATPLLGSGDLVRLHGVLHSVEALCGWPPDVEWTGVGEALHLLQARPVTGAARPDDERRWYLGLRPSLRRLRTLRTLVAEERLPALEAEGERLAAEDLEGLGDAALASALERRATCLAHWRAVYREEFIPLAHGVRALGTYYDDLVQPSDPFEFVGLVRGEELRAMQRNRELAGLGARLHAEPVLAAAVERALNEQPLALDALEEAPGGAAFRVAFDELRSSALDQELGGERLAARPDALLGHVLELSRGVEAGDGEEPVGPSRAELERRLFDAAGPARAEEARERLALGRLAWRLRDDDNLLLGRVESQLLRAAEEARTRLVRAGRLPEEERATERRAPTFAMALRAPDGGALELAPERADEPGPHDPRRARPRQLTGQPGSPGIASGPARHVRGVDDVGRFRRGDVLLCDAVQPNMTLLVPLAAAIVERRGGMLIHGAIIARELGIPCVNGVSRALSDVPDGELVTVDGDLGLVTVGEPELRLERVAPAPG